MSQFCPAKINLFLAVTGRRDDGFHSLVSLVLPLAWGDELQVESLPRGCAFRMECDNPGVPTGSGNLIWKAADLFAARTGWKGGWQFRLTKRIPMGAGLGGGSSDGAGALAAMNELAGGLLDRRELAITAAELGSDCPLFLAGGPVVMRGRGEIIEPVPALVREFLSGLRFILFKPAFAIGTAWAYGELARRAPDDLLSGEAAEERIRALLAAPQRLPELGFNSFEGAIASKFPAIPLLLDRLRGRKPGWVQMSGSGSACFFAVPVGTETSGIRGSIEEAWGSMSILAETGMLGSVD